jgi:hypothetical protein
MNAKVDRSRTVGFFGMVSLALFFWRMEKSLIGLGSSPSRANENHLRDGLAATSPTG